MMKTRTLQLTLVVSAITPAFAALYGIALGFPSLPAIDEILTILP